MSLCIPAGVPDGGASLPVPSMAERCALPGQDASVSPMACPYGDHPLGTRRNCMLLPSHGMGTRPSTCST